MMDHPSINESIQNNIDESEEISIEQREQEYSVFYLRRQDEAITAVIRDYAPDPESNPAEYLQSLLAIRSQSAKIYQRGLDGNLQNFEVKMGKELDECAKATANIIKRDFGTDLRQIPPHGRWQHFEAGNKPRVTNMIQSWPTSVDEKECTRRIIDVTVVSVLLDAGAGKHWKYKPPGEDNTYSRSEGLAIASLYMFQDGLFGTDDAKFQVNANTLKNLSPQHVANALQVSENNPMDGIDGRIQVLRRLGNALEEGKQYFGSNGRPGNMLDYILAHPSTKPYQNQLLPWISTLWEVLVFGLNSIWPADRISLEDRRLGDAWYYKPLHVDGAAEWTGIVPFHKLTQWLAYSILSAVSKTAPIKWMGVSLLTGLPEYRNGGLFMDFGVLALKQEAAERGRARTRQRGGDKSVELLPTYDVQDGVVVEWRALTIRLLDELLPKVQQELKEAGAEGGLTLAQMLEAGTWKLGREQAALSRGGAPPITVISDGTVF